MHLAEKEIRIDPKTDRALDDVETRTYLGHLSPSWTVVSQHHLHATYTFPDFKEALAFINAVGALAEAAQHHPDCMLGWGRVEIKLWTHDIGGLHLADFILAARIDRIQLG